MSVALPAGRTQALSHDPNGNANRSAGDEVDMQFVRLAGLVTGLVVAFTLWPSQMVAAEPDEASIRTAVESRLGAGLTLGELRFKVFDGNGMGRVSVAGSVVATEDWFRAEPGQMPRFREMTRAVGVGDEQHYRLINLVLGHISQPAYEVSLAAGVEMPMEGELLYKETVDGFSYLGGLSYNVCCQRLSDLPPGSVAYDTSPFELIWQQVMLAREREEKALETAKAAFGGLSSGATIMAGDKVLAHVAPVPDGTQTWAVVNRQLIGEGNWGWVVQSTVESSITVVSGSPMSIGYAQVNPGGTATRLTLNLLMSYQGAREEMACVEISANGLPFTGPSCWDGKSFARPASEYNALYDGTNNVRLQLRFGQEPAREPAKAAGNAEKTDEQAAVSGSASGIEAMQGEWFSPKYAYAFRVEGTTGRTTLSNAPAVVMGEPIFEFEMTGESSFRGRHIQTDGRFVEVTGNIEGDAMTLASRGHRWTMSRK
jgi:hypothetical protein